MSRWLPKGVAVVVTGRGGFGAAICRALAAYG